MLLLFVPDSEVVYRIDSGAELAANADRFVSRLAAERYVGYLQSQEAGITGQAGSHTIKRELNGLRASTRLPDQPDRAWVNAWLHRSYTTYWQQAGPRAG